MCKRETRSSIISGGTGWCAKLRLLESWRWLHKSARDFRLIKQTLCLDYLPVRALAFSVVALLSMAGFDRSEAAEPRFRPALIGNGLDALVNVINTKRLVEKGQGNAALSFHCNVNTLGRGA